MKNVIKTYHSLKHKKLLDHTGSGILERKVETKIDCFIQNFHSEWHCAYSANMTGTMAVLCMLEQCIDAI